MYKRLYEEEHKLRSSYSRSSDAAPGIPSYLTYVYCMFDISILKFSVAVFIRTDGWMLLLKLLLKKLQSAATV